MLHKNKRNFKHRFFGKIITGLVLVIISLLLYLFNIINLDTFSILFSIGTVLSLVSYLRYFRLKNNKEPIKDERTIKLTLYAANYSWFFTILFLCLLYWIDYFKVLKISASQTIIIIYFFMVVSVLLLKFYFNKKGDVNYNVHHN